MTQPIRIVRGLAGETWRSLTRQAPISSDPYGSHVPILIALGRILAPKRILELGGGFYSTPLLLDRQYFPSVEQLTTIETDSSWLDRLRSGLGESSHWRPQLIHTSVARWLERPDVKREVRSYDLIFVDDSPSAKLRSESLEMLFRAVPACPVCIHDVDLWQLRPHVWRHPKSLIFDGFLPQTAVCNVKQKKWMDSLRKARVELKPYMRKALETKSLQDWVRIGTANLPGSSAAP